MELKMKNHNLLSDISYREIKVEKRPLLDKDFSEIDGLFNYWIFLDNPTQLNSYTTGAIKEVILAFRQASCDRSSVAIIFSGTGEKAFCTGGNTKEYAEYYAGNPQEYKQYMRLFNDMVTQILLVDKPVINRVNGMRIGGGQEIGMACDFSIADTARFGQAGPKHGSAPDGGSTDFLHLFVGINRAIESCTLCEPWSAHQALRFGLINQVVPVLKRRDGGYQINPFVYLDEAMDKFGNPRYGRFKSGEDKDEAKILTSECKTDLALLDQATDQMALSLANTMPDCLHKTLESLRKKKLEHWQKNCETNRSWLALNMMTEANAGFRAFNEGPRNQREVDFLSLRRELAKARPWSEELVSEIMPGGNKD